MTDADHEPEPVELDAVRPSGADDGELYSVGRVAKETGIGAETLRMWERRYGRPVALRLPSGHRRYTHDQVVWLRRVAEALSRGARASTAVRADEVELEALLARDDLEVDDDWVERALDAVHRLDSDGLERVLLDGRDDLDVVTWLRRRVAELLRRVGSDWAAGSIDIRHEHLASERIEHVLRRESDRFAPPADAPLVLLGALSGEQHSLGLAMARLVALQGGWRVASLGPHTPVDQFARTAVDTGAAAVGVSVSLSTGGIETDRELKRLRDALPDGVHLVVGGEGAVSNRRQQRGVEVVESLRDAARWFAQRA